MPQWRQQAQGLKDVVGLRMRGHPGPGTVPRWRCAPTPDGVVTEVEERWTQDGKDWCCRDLLWAKARGEQSHELSVYCTGDWDRGRQEQHAKTVKFVPEELSRMGPRPNRLWRRRPR